MTRVITILLRIMSSHFSNMLPVVYYSLKRNILQSRKFGQLGDFENHLLTVPYRR